MKQLKIKSYTREDIASQLKIDINDSKHFKEKLTTTLDRLGYKYQYKPKEITITYIPTTALEKLNEIYLRVLEINHRIDTYSFSCFFYCMLETECKSMPWDKRVEYIKDNFNIEITKRTLQNWSKYLINKSIIIKDDFSSTIWKSYYKDDKIIREKLNENDKIVKKYTKDMLSLFEEHNNWNIVNSELWLKYHCKIYKCKGFSIPAWSNGDVPQYMIHNIYELLIEIFQKNKKIIV